MKKSIYFIIALVLLLTSAGHAASTDQKGEFSGRKSFEFNNLTLLIVDAGVEKCTFDYQKTPGEGEIAPFTKLTFSLKGKDFEVTDYQVSNNELIVNNVIYKFDATNDHLLIGLDGNPTPEQGEVHSSVQFLKDTTPGGKDRN